MVGVQGDAIHDVGDGSFLFVLRCLHRRLLCRKLQSRCPRHGQHYGQRSLPAWLLTETLVDRLTRVVLCSESLHWQERLCNT